MVCKGMLYVLASVFLHMHNMMSLNTVGHKSYFMQLQGCERSENNLIHRMYAAIANCF